ncbi:CoA transferase [Escherichia coli]|nr:hypothetical protein [Escherichia coli]EFC1844357.1 hypothetical protein [Escherichia coli]EFF9752827.1 AMP-binding protein [Escherichia coli]EFH3168516.1 AMP-binding protein [Escherichia coli]EFK4732899.1 AMP-binding protein [Escherichia coli]
MDHLPMPKFGPLAGLRVVFSGIEIAGPFAGQMFAEWGAEVIWIENVAWADTIRVQPNYPQLSRRNLHALSLNIFKDEGREAFLKLMETTDIFIEASKGPAFARRGITDEVLWQHNPKLVIAHLSGFGQYGTEEYTNLPAYNTIAQAFSGYLIQNGDVDQPMPAFPYTADYFSGLTATTAAMAAFSAGATFVLVEKYSARAFWGQVQKYRATITECIPMMIRTLMVQPPSANDRQHCLREVMFYLNLSEQEKDAFCERFSVRLLTSYGMTETIVGIIGDRPGDKRRWPSIGRAGFCYEAEIRDDHNRPLPAGELGEICIKGVPGKTIFKEYFLNPKATAKVLEADGWLHTGDTGYRDEEGFFYFVDRRCNMIKRGGENVSCVELENIIAAHPKIQDIVVVGIKDSIRDEAIKAFVVLNEGETLSEEEFFRFCEQNMAKFKVPSYLEIRKDLPRNCSGKIIRKNLK